MPTVTLDSIREAVETRYGPFVIKDVPGGDITLLPALRLPRERRQWLASAQQITADAEEGYDEDAVVEALHDMLRAAAAEPEQADRLIAHLGDNLAMLMEVVRAYGEASQLGEASASPT